MLLMLEQFYEGQVIRTKNGVIHVAGVLEKEIYIHYDFTPGTEGFTANLLVLPLDFFRELLQK